MIDPRDAGRWMVPWMLAADMTAEIRGAAMELAINTITGSSLVDHLQQLLAALF